MKTLSIITINKNNASGLEKTIKSVICQTSSDFEFIIIDGASDDESVDVIKRYADKIDYWVSEVDTGIYNAMNKGIRKAQGVFCLFLNSGDWLVSPKTLHDVFLEIENNSSDIFYSDVVKSDKNIIKPPANITICSLVSSRINHQNSLIKRSLFAEHGLYNENLEICSDHEFFLNECYKYKSVFFHINVKISIFDTNGVSSKNKKKYQDEDLIVYKNIFGELAELVIGYRDFRKTIYFDIINNQGNAKLLDVMLKLYRKIFRSTKKIFPQKYFKST